MGIDFITKAAASFDRGWSEQATALALPDLFTVQPELRGATYVAVPVAGTTLGIGDRYLAQVDGKKVLLFSGNQQIGELSNPPELLLSALHDCHGVTVMKVTKAHPISGAADIQISEQERPKE